jgi:cyclopropane-fatty-acyl-phospholipid synthase
MRSLAVRAPEPDRDPWLDSVLVADCLPEAVLRFGVRRLLRWRLSEGTAGGPPAVLARKSALVAELSRGSVAVHAAEANAQHYEVPTDFYRLVLGRRLKYSSGLWVDGVNTLEGAEAAMLALTCTRSAIEDGQHILDLGCGWGSLTLWLAERYGASRVTAVTNSRTQ